MKKKTSDLCITWIFVVIVFSTIILWGIESFTESDFDVELDGYTDSIENIAFSAKSFWDGSFQKSYSALLDSNLPLRGYMVRTYNTIRFKCFNVGNRPIGNNLSIFETEYLKCTNAIDEYDYSATERKQEVQDMVDHMESVNSKLASCGKTLFVYIAPSKASVCREDMPPEYVALSKEGAANLVDLFRMKIAETKVPCVFCEDYCDELKYPAFYPTGIHWSRTYEQISSRNIIDELSSISGKNYRNIELSDVKESPTPFWRDTDVYDLLNVWGYPELTYYEYNSSAQPQDRFDELYALLYRDSFGIGLLKDVSENIPEDRIANLSRDDFIIDFAGNEKALEDDWNRLDWQCFLDCSDIIIIEMTEPEIRYYTYGFLQYLDGYLDTYCPKERGFYFCEKFDCTNNENSDINQFNNGVYEKEEGFAWIKPSCRISIKDSEELSSGLEISYSVPEQVFSDNNSDIVYVYINGRLVEEKNYTSAIHDIIFISKDELGGGVDGGYTVDIKTSESFNPMRSGESSDNRDLALRLEYVGGIR